jgi:glucose/arabinose dehydrogenase
MRFRCLLIFWLFTSALFPRACRAADAPRIRLVPFLSGSQRPVACVDDGTGRLFVVEQHGRIRLARGGRFEPQPFLDITDRVYDRDNECGLLGLAFHPQFKTNGRFFVNYTTRQRGRLQTVVAEFHCDPAATRADASSEREILRFDQPWANHNGGCVLFGPDGMLYIGNGDGGAAGDPPNNAQRLNTWLGKILRIDVDHRQPSASYAVPPDNPFVGKAGALPEIWCYGMRNPWRFSFDRKTGALWCADVGQDKWEEIDVLEKGKNYGWSAREGTHDFKPERANGPMVEPVKDYGHNLGMSVTGGYVYRGKQMPALDGVYIYADYVAGRIWGLKRDGDAITLDVQLMEVSVNISSFGEDKDGELLVCDHSGGRILRIGQ